MSGGKKKSGFQITSVTTDYGQAPTEPQKSSFPGDSSGPPPQPQEPPAGKAVTNGGQSMAHSPPLASRQSGHGHSSSLGKVGVEGGEGGAPSLDPVASSSGVITTAGLAGAGVARVSNGPALLDPNIALRNHTSSSQPGSPVTKRKLVSQEHGGSTHSSRFRVVRLGQGLGEPYRRGRWTCVDFLEREGGEERGLRRVMDSMRHAHSLESLETVGLTGFEAGAGGTIMKPLGHIRALRSGHLVHSQGTTHLLAPHIGVDEGAPRKPFVEGPWKVESQKGSPAFRPQTFSSGPPSPTHKGPPNFDPSVSYAPRAVSPQARLLSPTKHPSESMRQRHIPSPLRLDMDAAGKSLLRETRSQPTSPSSILPRDRGFHQSATPIQTPSALSLAQSMFGVGGAFELGDGSGSSNSMIAIDNKIEQAMDLVKTHLMMAVREEVELLREQIKELTERNAQLERENYILRALRERD
ncbi:hypothetical protein COCON_G00044430 [Conger conger]|uniref:TSC22 domain family protein 4 n=1 Tax=Conger conger TaxID=82655 RepID=A0A9Q1I463_CONCO|nr:TSC22 domain family protein 4 isoform X2 [Conger conger]KAJ8281924.1 hypothetical protein COCON_G00044430 [Conger conger]